MAVITIAREADDTATAGVQAAARHHPRLSASPAAALPITQIAARHEQPAPRLSDAEILAIRRGLIGMGTGSGANSLG